MLDFNPRPKKLVTIIPAEFEGRISEELLVTDVQTDSREVAPGSLFIALRGVSGDGEKYIADAVANGAVAILVETDHLPSVLKVEVPVVGIADISRHVAKIADDFYDCPGDTLTIYGVTGTNGKSTITSLIAQMHALAGKRAAVVGTLGYGLVDENLTETGMTTPDVVRCRRIFAELRAAHAAVVAIEVSSHGIDQRRIEGVQFDVGVLSNITRDHLDYHGSFDKYAATKKAFLLSQDCHAAVINIDDLECKKVLAPLRAGKRDCVTYGIDSREAEVWAGVRRYTPSGIEAEIKSPWGSGKIFAPLVGKFNLSNVLASLSAVCLGGMDFTAALALVPQLHAVEGRLQKVAIMEMETNGEIPAVFIDYAHSSDALEQVINAIKRHVTGNLWVVFGCGGDRDRGKRAAMGGVASRLADRVIVTSDNPRTENPDAIIDEVMAGVKAGSAVEAISDRRLAIALAIGSCDKEDVVLIAGKGHEEYQVIGSKAIPFSDYRVAQNALQQRFDALKVAQ